MKTFTLAFMCLLFVGVSWGQRSYYLRDISEGEILNKAYAAATLDTTQTVDASYFKEAWLTVQSKDSGSILISYQLSLDGVTWGVATLYDSLSTASNAGAARLTNLSTVAAGAPYFRLILDPNVFNLGFSSATYSARITLK